MNISAAFAALSLVVFFFVNSNAQAQGPTPSPREAVDMPVPGVQNAYGIQQCIPFSQLQQNRSTGFLPCDVQVQTAVPFSGYIVVQRMCAADGIKYITKAPGLSISGPNGDPTSTTEDFPFFYSNDVGNYGWDEVQHISAVNYVPGKPGQYTINGGVYSACGVPHTDWSRTWNFAFVITANPPVAPKSVAPVATQQVVKGGVYKDYGRVTLLTPAPKSGILVMLTQPNWEIMELKTDYGKTGVQEPAEDLVYNSTYVYVPAGQQYADFDLIVSSNASPGDSVQIRATCVGVIPNYGIANECNAVNTNSPVVLKITVAP